MSTSIILLLVKHLTTAGRYWPFKVPLHSQRPFRKLEKILASKPVLSLSEFCSIQCLFTNRTGDRRKLVVAANETRSHDLDFLLDDNNVD
uniref:Putative secreted protein n=1 Tax=Anopheles darlingi TaxID=43151 RepID=A0A2M4DI90_ANODA